MPPFSIVFPTSEPRPCGAVLYTILERGRKAGSEAPAKDMPSSKSIRA